MLFSEDFELDLVELPKIGSQKPMQDGARLEDWVRFLGAKSRDELREAAMNREPELDRAWAAPSPRAVG